MQNKIHFTPWSPASHDLELRDRERKKFSITHLLLLSKGEWVSPGLNLVKVHFYEKFCGVILGI